MKTILFSIIALLSIKAHSHAEIERDTTKTLQATTFTVVLDAGHGGKDPGKYYAKTAEKDIALSVTKLVGEMLEKNNQIKVIYTRKTDKFLELYQRADIANDAKADFFVSIHVNAADSRAAAGNETFVLGLHRNADNLEVVKRENAVILLEENYEEKYVGFDPTDPSSFANMQLVQEEYLDNSIQMAAQIQQEFQSKLSRKNRGVKQAGFAVLRLTYMPSVLIETGFITNTEERSFLKTKKGQQKVAESIYDAILDYHKNRDINAFEVESIPDSEINKVSEGTHTIYKVQLAASGRKLPAKSYNFNKLPNITREKEGKIYRYFTGETDDLLEVKELLEQAKDKGYSSAFIVKYKNGERSRL